jgi:hypothetical protein
MTFPCSQKLAVLMPVFNGGEHLQSSLRSCAAAGLESGQYEIIVADNCSSDGAADHLPERDTSGAVIQVHHNLNNLGRVGNWNRCVEIALAQGFRYITFLFAGDCWIPNGSLPGLFRLMRESDACIGLSPFTISTEDGKPKRSSQRFYVSDNSTAVITPGNFVSTLLKSGLFPLGPLQANIYHISPNHVVRFDEILPTRTDVAATFEFIAGSRRPVAIVSKPFFEWSERPGRFHASMGVRQTARDYLDMFQAACEQACAPIDHGRGKTRAMLNCARLIVRDAPVSQWAALLTDMFTYAERAPYRSRLIYVIEALWFRFALRRRLLEFS